MFSSTKPSPLESVNLVVPLKKGAVAISEIEAVLFYCAECFNFLDDRVGHWIGREHTPLDLLASGKVVEFVGPLQITHRTEYDCQSSLSHHRVRWSRLVVYFAVRAENSLTVLHKVDFLAKQDLARQNDFTDPCFRGEGIQVNELDEHYLGHLLERKSVEYAPSPFFHQPNTAGYYRHVLFWPRWC